jgi:hypothetical protein
LFLGIKGDFDIEVAPMLAASVVEKPLKPVEVGPSKYFSLSFNYFISEVLKWSVSRM